MSNPRLSGFPETRADLWKGLGNSREIWGTSGKSAKLGHAVRLANPPASYRSLSGPPGPRFKKSLRKVSRGLRPRAPKTLEKVSKNSEKVPKVWKKSRTSPKSLEKVSKMSVRDFFEPFSMGPEAPGDFFQTLLGFRARRARETPVARGSVRNVRLFKASDCPHKHGRTNSTNMYHEHLNGEKKKNQ